MKLHLENINTKVGKLADQSVELGEGNSNADLKEVQNQSPVYNTLIISGSEPFIVFSVHYDRRYITRKFRNYR